MAGRVERKRRWFAWPSLGLAIALTGCYYAGFFAYSSQGGGTEAATGEEHEMNYPAHEAFLLTQDALRGEGILFEVKPEDSLVTLWRKADNSPGLLPSLVGVEPQYRYEVQVVPEGGSKSKIIINVRVEDIPDDQLDRYKASNRFDLFHKIEQLAALTPPPSNAPRTGGVNFALLPNEDLKGLAKRVTGSPDNWQLIAKDNGLTSPSDVTPFQTIWVRNSLLNDVPKQPSVSDSPRK